jgi:hypothetical protein
MRENDPDKILPIYLNERTKKGLLTQQKTKGDKENNETGRRGKTKSGHIQTH